MPKLEVSGGDSGVRARCGSTAGGAEDLVRVSDVVVKGNAPGISARRLAEGRVVDGMKRS